MELKIKNLEMHIWQMYEELSTECKERNEMEQRFSNNAQKLAEMKQKLARITDGVTFTKWKMELLNFDLNDLLINMWIRDWEKGLEEVFKKHFKEEIPKQK